MNFRLCGAYLSILFLLSGCELLTTSRPFCQGQTPLDLNLPMASRNLHVTDLSDPNGETLPVSVMALEPGSYQLKLPVKNESPGVFLVRFCRIGDVDVATLQYEGLKSVEDLPSVYLLKRDGEIWSWSSATVQEASVQEAGLAMQTGFLRRDQETSVRWTLVDLKNPEDAARLAPLLTVSKTPLVFTLR